MPRFPRSQRVHVHRERAQPPKQTDAETAQRMAREDSYLIATVLLRIFAGSKFKKQIHDDLIALGRSANVMDRPTVFELMAAGAEMVREADAAASRNV